MVAVPLPLLRLRDRILSIGARPDEPPDTRLRREALVLIVVTIAVLATIWSVTFLWLGLPLSAASPIAYQIVSLASLTSAALWEQLHDRYRFEERGVIDVKGLGEMRTYFLLGKA